VEHTDRACYQAIVEAKASVRSLRGYGPLPGAYRVGWGDYASHPFASELGLEPGGQEAIAAAWVDFDFVMEPGREVFRADRGALLGRGRGQSTGSRALRALKAA
jgi:hypothetical protein